MFTETRTYWKVGNGNCLAGGCTGFNSVWKDQNDVTVGEAVTEPPGALPITEAEYDAFLVAMVADAEVLIPQQNADLATAQADHAALIASARVSLEAGDPLTAAEAAALTGG